MEGKDLILFGLNPPIQHSTIPLFHHSNWDEIPITLAFERLGPTDNVHQFCRNGGLACLVI
jgi:hypothetical protein